MRVTKAEMHNVANALNAMLQKRGSTARVDVSGRNDYQGIDLADADGHIETTLMCGTTGEVVAYLRAMQQAVWLLDPERMETNA